MTFNESTNEGAQRDFNNKCDTKGSLKSNNSKDIDQNEYQTDEVDLMVQKRNKIGFGFPSTAPIHFDLNKMVQPTSFNFGIKPTRIIVRKSKR